MQAAYLDLAYGIDDLLGVRMDKSAASTVSRDHFSRIVPHWSHFGPPLRPSPDDTAVMQRAASVLAANARAVVLGLTPEIIGCRWPHAVKLTAVDHSPVMIKAMWPPVAGPVDAQVAEAGWDAMPIESASVDLVAGDGCYVLQAYPAGFDALTREVCRILAVHGHFAIRTFLRPDRPESIAEIGQALAAGAIGSVHALKLRLLAAVHGASGAGSRLGDAWQASKSLPALPQAMAGKRGWTAEETVGLEAYRGLDARYFLPTLAEFRQCMPPVLAEIDCAWGRHELAERCPTLVFRHAGQG